ncbi:MAG: hypothetical protein J5594_00125 [Elusimicrobiaceae bacterium]|nr:hypothetical protein [Elusimicrobiaceae bacterium]
MRISLNQQSQVLSEEGSKKLKALNFKDRFYKHDATLWKTEKEHTDIINNSLGWTNVYDWTLTKVSEVKNFAEEVKKEFSSVVLMGMGGSSLAPEVLRVIFGKQEGYPTLFVLDTTNPTKILEVTSKINLEKTLFIFASKSGGTVEPSSQFAYFYDLLSKKVQNPGNHFIAITDPNTGLVKLGEEKHFRKIFINKADIGGRFSALSLFGMLPAALAGIDIEKLLKATKEAGDIFQSDENNPACVLGSLMGQGFLNGKDKLTLIMPKEISVLGLWIEQLIAESTGKEKKGILPVVTEEIVSEKDYLDDRIFVNINYQSKSYKNNFKTMPYMEIDMEDKYQIGVQFLLWEIATAAAGAIMKIDPFDQPNVQLSKTITKNILTSLAEGKKDEAAKAEFLVSNNLQGEISKKYLLSDIAKLASNKDYFAVLAYLPESEALTQIFNKMKDGLFKATHRAIIFGYGPRYLHSTGQLFKGDAGKGIFVIFSSEAKEDAGIPSQPYTFKDLCQAQALADYKALEEKGRRVIKIHLPAETEAALKELLKTL